MSSLDLFIQLQGIKSIELNNGNCIITDIPEGEFDIDVKGLKLTINGENREIILNLRNVG